MSKGDRESVAVSTKAGSGVFLGRHDFALDPKKRFTIPSEWRGAPVMPVHPFGSEAFVARGGRIPAPMQSLKN